MKRQLAYYGDPVLRKKGQLIEKIDDTIHQLVQDMTETMVANDGCGLAAPQVHQSLALFITCIPRNSDDETPLPGELRVFINPKIVSYSENLWSCQEGCLSIPGLRKTVARPQSVTIQATDLEGKMFVETFIEFDAHVMMHENDHINGVLFIDRLSARDKKDIDPFLKKIKKKYQTQ
ncbi:MAG: peptide deformylase [Parachlamydiaceae bacterium]